MSGFLRASTIPYIIKSSEENDAILNTESDFFFGFDYGHQHFNTLFWYDGGYKNFQTFMCICYEY